MYTYNVMKKSLTGFQSLIINLGILHRSMVRKDKSLRHSKLPPSPITFPAHSPFQGQQNSFMGIILWVNSWKTGTKFPLLQQERGWFSQSLSQLVK